MTVCIAALCNMAPGGSQTVVGAADRMITIQDIEFEPDQTKLFMIAPSVMVMVAGDMRVHASVAVSTMESLKTEPPSPLTVRAIAERYGRHFADYRRYINEQTFLAPLGIKNARDFLVKQREMAPSEAATI